MNNRFEFLVFFILALFSPFSLCAEEAYVTSEKGTLTFYYDNNKESHSGNVYDVATEYVGEGIYPAWQSDEITKVTFDHSFSNFLPTSTARWFHSCSGIKEIENISNLNTSAVTNMNGMFYGCRSLKTLSLNSFNTGNVTNMDIMFYECSSLENLDLSTFDTSNVTSMIGMFYCCTQLEQLNVSSFNTSNVEDMQYMFFCCGNLTSIDVTSFNTSKVTNMERMFSCEERLGCIGNLTSLDLSTFNTEKVTNMKRMFQDNVKLTTIYVDEGWSTESITIGDYLFFGCLKLVGGIGTVCDGIFRTDYTYAHVDSDTMPGYFTYKQSPVDVNSVNCNIVFSDKCYSFDGRLVVRPTKGLYIRDGKKFIVK